MHIGNIVVAWAFAVQDRLRDGLRQIGVEARELAALTLVAAYDGATQDWLRTRIDLTQSGTVRLVDRLAGRGLLRRGPSAGRGVPLHLTDAGADLLQRWSRARDEAVAELLEALPEEARAPMLAGMTHGLRARPRLRLEADATCRACTWPACGSDCPVDRSVAGLR